MPEQDDYFPIKATLIEVGVDDRYHLALQALVDALGPCGQESDRSCWHRRDTFSGALLEWAFLRPCSVATARAVLAAEP